MILEGIVTTISPQGTINIAPMGPIVDDAMRRLVLRPFQTSDTYRNLKHHGEGVFHVTDDVLLLARAALGPVKPMPELERANRILGYVLADACRAYEFAVTRLDDAAERVTIEVEVVHAVRQRDFFGFNRARHAVLEAAILATRLHLLPHAEIAAEFTKLKVLVDKTGGPREHEAFAFLERHLHEAQSPLAAQRS